MKISEMWLNTTADFYTILRNRAKDAAGYSVYFFSEGRKQDVKAKATPVKR